MAALLFEYAATLGMVDVPYFDPADVPADFRYIWGADNLQSFRITPLGAYIFGLTTTCQPVMQASDVAISVLPSLQIKMLHGTLSAQGKRMFELWAESAQTDSWLLDREKTVTAIEKATTSRY